MVLVNIYIIQLIYLAANDDAAFFVGSCKEGHRFVCLINHFPALGHSPAFKHSPELIKLIFTSIKDIEMVGMSQ